MRGGEIKRGHQESTVWTTAHQNCIRKIFSIEQKIPEHLSAQFFAMTFFASALQKENTKIRFDLLLLVKRVNLMLFLKFIILFIRCYRIS